MKARTANPPTQAISRLHLPTTLRPSPRWITPTSAQAMTARIPPLKGCRTHPSAASSYDSPLGRRPLHTLTILPPWSTTKPTALDNRTPPPAGDAQDCTNAAFEWDDPEVTPALPTRGRLHPHAARHSQDVDPPARSSHSIQPPSTQAPTRRHHRCTSDCDTALEEFP